MKAKNPMKVVMKHPPNRPVGVSAASAKRVPPADLMDIILPNFPHVAEKITTLWGSWELHSYFSYSLLIMDRDHREGFPRDVMSALLKLHAEHVTFAQLHDPRKHYDPHTKIWD
jgi:hypothetical protein